MYGCLFVSLFEKQRDCQVSRCQEALYKGLQHLKFFKDNNASPVVQVGPRSCYYRDLGNRRLVEIVQVGGTGQGFSYGRQMLFKYLNIV